MESPPSSPTSLVVNSPRRTLSLLRERRHKHPAIDPDENPAVSFAAGFAEEHGLKPSEVYGFVGSITTVLAAVIFVVWAYTPEPWLHYLGITYYPSKYWAIAIPSFIMVTVVLAMVFYLGLNFMVTPSPTSFNVLFDEHSRERPSVSFLGEEQPIEPIYDIPVDQINNLIFG
ncbi:phosphatidylinositol N-acetylglucosaminyltransferase subunit P-like [Zingiber officinale]|uniref:phosphatidylinositol N-acetylglucosaminyltransferase subunit P-like n=1 Tax=Zingiber officinale TaxID=94328 RepID=UPI001C4CB57E|nr:phosphatidylinositol N-acetylglucosaminyltransferase subunit P-like [Zingiber officinale]XP_042409073.1 phosphatidylinositol N-acetylglucosaminyltransferase subunit P-like [Zingiber officinale]XP_042409074.1 phosphatidylinositol N-acetylglucosaminyltransferase subunit P-like [Zingiber officinale]